MAAFDEGDQPSDVTGDVRELASKLGSLLAVQLQAEESHDEMPSRNRQSEIAKDAPNIPVSGVRKELTGCRSDRRQTGTADPVDKDRVEGGDSCHSGAMHQKQPRVRRGSGLRGGTRKDCSIFFANVTSASDEVLGWVRDSNHDIDCLAKLHLRGMKLKKFSNEVDACKRVCIASEAEASATSEDGCYGGVCVLPKTSLSATLLHESIMRLGCWQHEEDSLYLAGVQINFAKGLHLQVYTSYHRGQPNLEILAAVHRRSASGNVPFLLLGDFNMDKKQFQDKFGHWLELMGAEIVSSGSHTCSLGVGNELDFGIVSKQILHLVTCEALNWNVPWGLHAGLLFKISRDPVKLHKWVREVAQVGDQTTKISSETSCLGDAVGSIGRKIGLGPGRGKDGPSTLSIARRHDRLSHCLQSGRDLDRDDGGH